MNNLHFQELDLNNIVMQNPYTPIFNNFRNIVYHKKDDKNGIIRRKLGVVLKLHK